MRRRHLKPDVPLLVGRLDVVGNGRRMPPTLYLNVWCPYCKRRHHHGWAVELASDDVSHRVAHCPSPESPFHAGGYYVGLDPDPSLKAEHKRAMAEWREKAAIVEARKASDAPTGT